jgi:hypothetical protein
LVTGGTADSDLAFPLPGAEVYDPPTGSWSTVSPLHFGRSDHAAIRLDDGRVLVVGNTNIVELFDPVTGKWSITVLSMCPAPTSEGPC